MRKNIVIFSQTYHAFLLNEIYYASRVFEKVVVITPFEAELQAYIDTLDNVIYRSFTRKQARLTASAAVPGLFSKAAGEDRRRAKRAHVNDRDYYIKSLVYLTHFRLFSAAISEFPVMEEPENWVLLSAWYESGAFSIAKFKKACPKLLTISLAHSIEIDKRRQKHTDVLYRYEYHKYIDHTYFISKTMLREFLEGHAEKLGLDKTKFEVRYLGTKKRLDGENPGNADPSSIVMVSCSNFNAVKRVERIFEAVKCITGYKVKWIHIKGGDAPKELQDAIEGYKDSDKEISWVGPWENPKVHAFYVETPIDLFVNTSFSEGVPVSIMEALAYGIPALATNVGGNPEIVDASCGQLVDVDASPEEIAKAIIRIKEANRGEDRPLSSGAVAKYQSLFNSDNMREAFYEELSRM